MQRYQPYVKRTAVPTTPAVPTDPKTDEEYRLAIATQQSAYSSANTQAHAPSNPKLTVKRQGGGKTWDDPSLLEWDPSHFRLFVGNLGADVTDDTLINAFKIYPSFVKARVIIDKKTAANKGYGFVSFKNPDDYFKAFKEKNNKYIGSHPIQLKRANTDIKPSNISKKNKKNNNHKNSYKKRAPR